MVGGPDGPGPFVPEVSEDLNEDGEIDEATTTSFYSWSLYLAVPVVLVDPVLSFLILRIGWPATKPRI